MSIDYVAQKGHSKDVQLNTTLGDYRRKINELVDEINDGVFPGLHATAHVGGADDEVDHDLLKNYVANQHIDWKNAAATFKNAGLMQFANVSAPGSAPANMIQLWGADRFAGNSTLYYRPEAGLARPLTREFDVSDYGMIPDDNTGTVPADNVAVFDAIIAEMTAGDVMYFPRGTWYINADLDVTVGITIRGDGEFSIIEQEEDGQRGFDITVSDTWVRDLKLVGTGAPTGYTGSSDAIYFHGANASNYLSNIKVTKVAITSWKMYGILTEWIENFEFASNNIQTITYAGVMALSSQDGRIHHNYIDDIKGHSNDNAYGISLARYTGDNLSVYPRCKRIVIDSNNVSNVLTWDGISTHAAENCFFNNNTVISTRRGINCVSDNTNAPLNNTISNNIVDIGSVTPGEADGGVGFAGEDASNLATGCIIGNIIIGHGLDNTDIAGALKLKYTQGVAVTGNRLIGSCSRGIQLYIENYNFVVSGNTILDVWSANRNVIAIQVRSTNNIGYIGENSWANVTRSSGYYLGSGTSYGIYIYNGAGNAISLGNNHHEDADTYISDGGNKSTTINHDSLTGFVANEHIDWTGASSDFYTTGKGRFNGNVGINTGTFGSNADKVFAAKAGTAPTSSPTDVAQLWAENVEGIANRVGWHMRSEGSGTLIVPGIFIKDDTGDPGDHFGGMICINKFDNNIRMWAEGAWRTLASW